MVDGDVLLDKQTTLPSGCRMVFHAVEDQSYPGGCNYRLHCYHPDDGPLLRYDNDAGEDIYDVGPHHRHYVDEDGNETVEGLAFTGLPTHVDRFTTEVKSIHAQRYGP